MNMCGIEKNVPLPPRTVTGRLYLFRDMKVGDSFKVELDDGEKALDIMRRVAGAAGAFAGRNAGYHFATRIVTEDGQQLVRVWRTKERTR